MSEQKCYRFKMTRKDVQFLINHSTPSLRQDHIYNVIKCDFIWFFEKWYSYFENFHTKLQKTSYIINMQPKRESTPFMRINGFCKKCCYETRVKYLIIIQKQIDESKEYVRV